MGDGESVSLAKMFAMENEPLGSAEDLEPAEDEEVNILSLQETVAGAADCFLPASTRIWEVMIGVAEM